MLDVAFEPGSKFGFPDSGGYGQRGDAGCRIMSLAVKKEVAWGTVGKTKEILVIPRAAQCHFYSFAGSDVALHTTLQGCCFFLLLPPLRVVTGNGSERQSIPHPCQGDGALSSDPNPAL